MTQCIPTLFLLLLASAHAASGTADDAVRSLWRALSHPAGQAADVASLQRLFHPEARVLGVNARSKQPDLRVQTAADFIVAVGKVSPTGFYECEVTRRSESYGDFATVYSVVESRRDAQQAVADFVGVNSLQLHRSEAGWRIVSLYYHTDHPALPIPLAGGRSGQCLE